MFCIFRAHLKTISSCLYICSTLKHEAENAKAVILLEFLAVYRRQQIYNNY